MPKFLTISELTPGSLLVDVRTRSEFAGGHIASAVNLPLDEIESRIPDMEPDRPLVLVCKAGTRASMAAELIRPCRPNTAVLAGGMDAWYREGLPVVVSSRTRWSLERQVRLIAGLMVLCGVVAGFVFNPRWALLSGLVGLGLTFAGLTDICAMGILLARMPWNRTSKLRANREMEPATCRVNH